jgi:protease-4
MTENTTCTTPTLELLAAQFIKEQKRKRRWGLFFKFFYLILIILLLVLILPDHSDETYKKSQPHTAVIDLSGPIFSGSMASAKHINEALDDAFKNNNTVGVILDINSPGGSPVQADEVYYHIKWLRKKHPNIKVYAVCEDVCASGSYYIAAAADEIYANPASLVGSIGVIMEGFGLVDTLQKVGATRRVFTAGVNKDFMDPFQPLKPADVTQAQALLDTVHQQFITAVKQGRGKRLKPTLDMFSGEVWTGTTALPLGLIDGFGDVNTVAGQVIKNDTLVDYTVKPGFFDQLTMLMGKSVATEFAKSLGLTAQPLQLS